jgi:hypothetical protein
MLGTEPECQAVTMPTVDNNNIESTQTAYVLTNDLQNMSPCWFPSKKNPITNEQCREAFTNLNNKKEKKDFLEHVYVSAVTLLAFYIFLKLWLKK